MIAQGFRERRAACSAIAPKVISIAAASKRSFGEKYLISPAVGRQAYRLHRGGSTPRPRQAATCRDKSAQKLALKLATTGRDKQARQVPTCRDKTRLTSPPRTKATTSDSRHRQATTRRDRSRPSRPHRQIHRSLGRGSRVPSRRTHHEECADQGADRAQSRDERLDRRLAALARTDARITRPAPTEF